MKKVEQVLVMFFYILKKGLSSQVLPNILHLIGHFKLCADLKIDLSSDENVLIIRKWSHDLWAFLKNYHWREYDFYIIIGHFTLWADLKIYLSSDENVLFMRKWSCNTLRSSEKLPMKRMSLNWKISHFSADLKINLWI